MKLTKIRTALVAFAALASPALAESSFERDKALATAAEPINRRYREQSEQLLLRATQANDLDAAVKIKREVDSQNPANKLQDTRWSTEAAIGGTVALNADGSAINPVGAKGTWKYIGENKVTIKWDKPQIWILDPSFQFLTHPDGSKWNRTK